MKIVIVGAGPSGLMCAVKASENVNNQVIVLEKNDKVGKKLYITGKGRCNVCNNSSTQEILQNIVTNNKFMISSLNLFSSTDVINFFETNGTKLKTERGNRVFPITDKASDITKTFLNVLKKRNVSINLNCEVKAIDKYENNFYVKTNKEKIVCDAVVVCTGGKSYMSTGSTGDGYKFAKILGHNTIDIKPALVPIKLKNFDSSLAGLSLKNVNVSIKLKNKSFSQFGEMLFTHNGLSGPIILTLSSYINKFDVADAILSIDLKPALTLEQLDERLLKDIVTYKNKSFKNYLKELLPNSLIDFFVRYVNIEADKVVCSINKLERKKVVNALKSLEFKIDQLDNIDYAIVTSGGVDVKQLNPKTLESKIVKNLFFVGEVLDVDALTGGFNIQIALSTGFAAGKYLNEVGG